MSLTNRILFSDNGVITDISNSVLDYYTGTATIASWAATQDYLYFGAIAPFNHLYVKMSTASVVASNVMTVEYWNGREWIEAFETIDQTSGFTQSGYVTFFPDRNEGWQVESTNDQGESVTGLTTVSIYNLYWARIKLSLSVPLGFAISWAGQKFSNDSDLGSEFPSLVRSSMLISFGATKTDWEEQHVKAAELIVQDLVANSVIDSKEQILVREEFTLSAIQKVAEIIFGALGDDYIDQKRDANTEYRKRLDKSIFRVDKNKDALLGFQETLARTGFMTR